LADAIRKELATLGMPSVLEMALVSTRGIVLYSDLSKVAMSRISPFYESITRMAIGDNLSLALDTTKTIVASRISNGAVLITVTDKKVGIILTKMGGVSDKFGRLLDELIASEEARGTPGGIPREAYVVPPPGATPLEPTEGVETPTPVIESPSRPEPVTKEAEPPTPAVEETRPPPAPAPKPVEAKRIVVERPVATIKEVKEIEAEPKAAAEEVAGLAPSLDPSTILEVVPKPKTDGITLDGEMIKFVRLVDGSKTIDDVAKAADVRLDRAMKKLGILMQEGILKVKYDDPVYMVVPKVAGKLDSELQSMAFAKADLPKLTPEVMKLVDGKKNVLAMAKELDLEPERLRDILKTLEKRKMIKL
jgi:hypothetical protein